MFDLLIIFVCQSPVFHPVFMMLSGYLSGLHCARRGGFVNMVVNTPFTDSSYMPYVISASAQSWHPRHALTERSAGPLRARSRSAVRSGSQAGLRRHRAEQSGQLISLHVASIICLLLSQGLTEGVWWGHLFPHQPLFPVPASTHTHTQPGGQGAARLRISPPEREARQVRFGCCAPVAAA